jgi:type II secretory pathway component PulJ
MDNQDTKFNYKVILAALFAVIIGILIAFYYSYAQSNTQIGYLEKEKELLVKDLTLMKADVDRLSALQEMNDIELQDSKYQIDKLLDSVGRLSFTIGKLREFKSELRRLETINDSLKIKNDFLQYNNMQLTNRNEESQKQIERLRTANNAITEAESLQKEKMRELNEELKTKQYLKIENAIGSAYRMRGGRLIQSNKASIIKKLRGIANIEADAKLANQERVLYFQFLGPNMGIIEDNANTITVNGNIYSKRIELVFNGEATQVSDYITLPEGSLEEGSYTLNIFEDERLLQTTEFQLK